MIDCFGWNREISLDAKNIGHRPSKGGIMPRNDRTKGDLRPVGRRVFIASIALAAAIAGCGPSPDNSSNAGPDAVATKEPTIGFDADKQHDMFFEKGDKNQGYPTPAYGRGDGRPEDADDDW